MNHRNGSDTHTKEEMREQLTQELLYLARVTSLLKSRRFLTWYMRTPSRWSWAGSALFTKLQSLLMFQVDQALVRESQELPVVDRIRLFADKCEKVMQDAAATQDIKIGAAQSKFALAHGQDADKEICRLLGAYPGLMRTAEVVRDTFYVRNGLGSFQIYALARETIARGSGNKHFDQLVLDPLDEDYLVKGYPHDVLTHDANDVRVGAKVRAVVLQEDYCSSHLLYEHNAQVKHAKHVRVIELPMAA